METLALPTVTHAVTEAIWLGAVGFDAIKQITLAHVGLRRLQLDQSRHPHLPKMDVRTTAAATEPF